MAKIDEQDEARANRILVVVENVGAAVVRFLDAYTARLTGTTATPAPTPAPAPAAAPAPTKAATPAKKTKDPCAGCGIDQNDPNEKHSAACEVAAPKAETPAPAEEKKANGKKVDVEEMVEDAKKLFLELAQKTSRQNVVDLLATFGVQRLSDVPVAQMPEFLASLRTALKKAA